VVILFVVQCGRSTFSDLDLGVAILNAQLHSFHSYGSLPSLVVFPHGHRRREDPDSASRASCKDGQQSGIQGNLLPTSGYGEFGGL
jgi:hypothetical protein